MTKEQMIAKVEMAHEIYEKVKVLPVPEREAVFQMVHQFNYKDWNDYHNSQKVGYASNCDASDVAQGTN